jgi:hypothetical protein
MMSKLVVALAVLAFSFVLGTSRSYAEDAGIACPPPAMDIVADLAEELDVACHSQMAADATPTAIEGQAILVEISQSVTIAALGQSLEGGEGSENIGSVQSAVLARE